MEEKLSRREVREGAFIILYQTLFGQTPQEITEADEEAFGLARSHETDLIVNGVLSHDEEITGIIAKYSTTRSVARISKVNLIIMKIVRRQGARSRRHQRGGRAWQEVRVQAGLQLYKRRSELIS